MTKDPIKCDVLIVGGGPAGLALASTLPDDVKTVIVHQDKEIGLPIRTSGGSWLRDVERLGVPADMYHLVRRADAYADETESEIKLGDETVVILDTPRVYKWLAAQSDHKDREILLATKFL
ncbi:MAG TPA: FAD-binding protein, partial [Rhodobacterales bacterium]|nr:FAD-binding protein [Rhodobacterales bacterium]